MKGFFSVDGPLYRFVETFWSLIKLNFCWLVTGAPLIAAGYLCAFISQLLAVVLTLIGAGFLGVSTVTAFYVLQKMVDNREGYIFKMFFREWKKNLKVGYPMGFINAIAIWAIFMDFQLYNAVTDPNDKIRYFFLAGGIILSIVGYFTFVYAYPLAGRYDNTWFACIKNSSRIVSRYFGRTMLMTLVIAFEIAIFIWNQFLMVIGALIAPVTVMYTISGMSMYMFREIEKGINSGDDGKVNMSATN